MRMGQTKAQLVAKYSYRPWMGQMKTLQVASYSYEDGTDEGPAKDPVGPAVRFLSQHVFHVLQEAHYTCTNIDTVTS